MKITVTTLFLFLFAISLSFPTIFLFLLYIFLILFYFLFHFPFCCWSWNQIEKIWIPILKKKIIENIWISKLKAKKEKEEEALLRMCWPLSPNFTSPDSDLIRSELGKSESPHTPISGLVKTGLFDYGNYFPTESLREFL